MQVIIISANKTGHRHWHLTPLRLTLIALTILTLLGLSAISLHHWSQQRSLPASTPDYLPTFTQTPRLFQPAPSLSEQDSIHGFYAKQLGGLQAEAIRLKVLSERLAEVAGLDISEFMLDEPAGVGGIEFSGDWLSSHEFEEGLGWLSAAFSAQGTRLSSLQDFLITNDNITSAIPFGKPVPENKTWLSSFYGQRVDPFSGRKAYHRGLDFAGREGTTIHAVADGIVSWSGMRGAYGGLIEIDHGNGYVTRYAHNKTLKVEPGQRVSRGQVIALMGSTGRSTAPHVHYEVIRDGKPVNPYNYLN
ncbi:MAG: M23 family metallopeptidase [Methylophaga sp.]|nr:M23 family metallopeptidase [Methylophaga sp.]